MIAALGPFGPERVQNRPAILLDDGQVRPGCRIRFPAALFPFLKCSGIDAERACEFPLRHPCLIPDASHIHLVRQNDPPRRQLRLALQVCENLPAAFLQLDAELGSFPDRGLPLMNLGAYEPLLVSFLIAAAQISTLCRSLPGKR